LELAGVQAGDRNVTLISVDAYRTTVSLEEAKQPENFLAYELEGKPLPVLHGFPLRAVFPGLEGNKWARWVVGIEVE
jgi:DMSO/TMAO reductase YedYZ molybdopterin-dependent catalytic subunit